MIRLALLVTACLCVGCAATYRWVGPSDGDRRAFLRDEYECSQEASRYPPAWWVWPATSAEWVYEKCMTARGYRESQQGEYEAVFRRPPPFRHDRP
jgi:hypothetical protein